MGQIKNIKLHIVTDIKAIIHIAMFQKEQLELLKQFVLACKANPAILQSPELKFFKDWIESLGGKVPVSAAKPDETPKEEKPAFEPTIDDDSEEEEEVVEEPKESEDEEL